jgi:hypothetical protein
MTTHEDMCAWQSVVLCPARFMHCSSGRKGEWNDTFDMRANPDAGEVRDLRARLAARYPVARFAEARRALDPSNILSNHIVDALLPRDDVSTA